MWGQFLLRPSQGKLWQLFVLKFQISTEKIFVNTSSHNNKFGGNWKFKFFHTKTMNRWKSIVIFNGLLPLSRLYLKECWFLAKNQANFMSLLLKLDNPYCHCVGGRNVCGLIFELCVHTSFSNKHYDGVVYFLECLHLRNSSCLADTISNKVPPVYKC